MAKQPQIVHSIDSPRMREFYGSYQEQPYSEPTRVIGIDHYLWLLRKAWWKIALAVVIATGLATYAAFSLVPMYESTAKLAIDLRSPSTVVGEGETAISGSDADQYFNTELQVIQSDTVLRPVAKQFNLNAVMTGRASRSGAQSEDAPVSLKNLTVTHPVSSYLIDIVYRSPNPVQAAAVANAVAESYIIRGREMRARAALDESDFMERQLVELKKNMDDSVSALAYYEKELGVIDPEEKTSILTARLAQMNTEYTEAENDRVQKEVAFKAIQSGSTAAIDVSPQATALVSLEEKVRSAQQKMESVKAIYGTANPEYKRTAGELAELNTQLNALHGEVSKRIQVEYDEALRREELLRITMLGVKSQADALNASSIRYQELKREADANKNLYTELYRKVKEEGINGAFQNHGIRITDTARPSMNPVFPNKKVMIGLSGLFAFVLSIIAVLLSDHNNNTVRDPEQTQRQLGTDVLGILPQVLRFSDLSPLHLSAPDEPASLVKSPRQWFGTETFYQEAARALLSTILSSNRGTVSSGFEGRLNSIMVTSASKGEGKSCCVAHLAALHALQGYRTLLIDADLRCPTLHRYFKMPHQLGIADAITSGVDAKLLRRPVPGTPLLDLITAGKDSAKVCNQAGRTVGKVLEAMRSEYDLIFIDAPPMLCFAEPIQLAGQVDGVLVVCRAGDTSEQEVAGVLNALRRVGGKTLGVILNQVHPRLSRSYEPYQSYYRRAGEAARKTA